MLFTQKYIKKYFNKQIFFFNFVSRLEHHLRMLQKLEIHFSDIEDKIIKLKNDYQNLRQEYNTLLVNYNKLEEKFDEEKKAHKEVVEELKNIKLISAISGNPEHNRLMKNHINRLVKEIDICIAQLQNSGL